MSTDIVKYSFVSSAFVALGLALTIGTIACGDDSNASSTPSATASNTSKPAVKDPADAGDDKSEPTNPTYYADMRPLFERSCLGCHVAGGIGPFPLDNPETAKAHAAEIAAAVDARLMPPYLVTNDGTCGTFANAPTLSDAEITVVKKWAATGAEAGKEQIINQPGVEHISNAAILKTPDFIPAPGGTLLDEHDDYRCFLLDTPEQVRFITGYNVIPGNTKIVHHLVMSLITLDDEGRSPDGDKVRNGDLIEAMDALDPDVEGWRCFGLAGEGVKVTSVPIVWAPGQGVVHYPDSAGIPLLPNQKIVVQVHYNLEDHATIGEMDSTSIELELKDPATVPNVGVYIPADPLLDSLQSGGTPHSLAPGRESEPFVWNTTLAEMGLGGLPAVKLWGVFPHMHQLGHRYTLALNKTSDSPKCMAQVNRWDFHWQHIYFYQEAQIITPSDRFEITCDYDTRNRKDPVLPGWGTQNEMCFLGLFFTVPNKP